MDPFTLTGSTAMSAGLQQQAAAQAAALQSSSNGDPKKARAAAQQFEGFFVSQMMDNMMEGVQPDEVFGGGFAEDTWRPMLNQEYGKEIAKSGRLGIADSVVSSMLKMQEQASAKAAADAQTGASGQAGAAAASTPTIATAAAAAAAYMVPASLIRDAAGEEQLIMDPRQRDLAQKQQQQRPDPVRGPARAVATLAAPKAQMRPQAMAQGTIKAQIIPAPRAPLPQPVLSRPISPILSAQEAAPPPAPPRAAAPRPLQPRPPVQMRPPVQTAQTRPSAQTPPAQPRPPVQARPPVQTPGSPSASPAASQPSAPRPAGAPAGAPAGRPVSGGATFRTNAPQPRPAAPQPRPAAPLPGGYQTSVPRASQATGHAPKAPAKIEDLFQIVRQLCEILTKENAALKRHRTEEVQSFAERKESLARIYQAHMAAIQRDPGPLKALDPARRALLQSQASRLGQLMAENAALLKGSIQSINMYFKAVTDAVRERQEKMAAAYSRRGAMSGYIAKRSLAVSFNQTM